MNDRLAELTEDVVRSMTARREISQEKLNQQREAEERRKADERALQAGMRVTSSFTTPDQDAGGGLRSVGQGSRRDSHGPEADRQIPIKRKGRLR